MANSRSIRLSNSETNTAAKKQSWQGSLAAIQHAIRQGKYGFISSSQKTNARTVLLY
jgi:hypothetical protein